MRNIIITTLVPLMMVPVMLVLTSCTWEPDLSDIGLPRVHKIDVPQGNVIS